MSPDLFTATSENPKIKACLPVGRRAADPKAVETQCLASQRQMSILPRERNAESGVFGGCRTALRCPLAGLRSFENPVLFVGITRYDYLFISGARDGKLARGTRPAVGDREYYQENMQ